MILSWGSPLKSKSLTAVYGSGWEKGEFKFIEYRKTPLGWDFNLWRLSLSYDNFGKVKRG
ncbi:hypothetical protein [Paenibacillus agilis]|uniref:Uncharacterized protein n=1 Tax=Paenibacillus agilis TaxID=3020863 RepID=A0A559IE94_9BACL|nr:hypothetical protein [Paenibacillus agilis]TVX85974.1 hypothetical protein FPZ44_23770 [Paenibacillus agilis]